MAYVVPTKRGTFEVRESHVTPNGPRSRTLATFREMTDEVIEKARSRASKPLETEELTSAAARAGAPVPGTPVDQAARETLRLLASGEQLDPMLRALLLDALDPAPGVAARSAVVSDAARSATEWIGASPERRGEALRDLLELGDALPVLIRSDEIGFPRLRSD
jgi:hypothetical protein